MDNRILVYSANKGFKISKRKVFKGHYTSGYAIQVRRAHRRCSSTVSHAIGRAAIVLALRIVPYVGRCERQPLLLGLGDHKSAF
jgi:hypothetical protein